MLFDIFMHSKLIAFVPVVSMNTSGRFLKRPARWTSTLLGGTPPREMLSCQGADQQFSGRSGRPRHQQDPYVQLPLSSSTTAPTSGMHFKTVHRSPP